MLETFISPISELPLVLTSTGIQANEKIVPDLLKAAEIGNDQMKKFVDEHIGTNSTILRSSKKEQATHIQEHE